jgi:PKHD-type hydroxylase
VLLAVPDVLSAPQLNRCLEQLAAADWVDGRVSAGYQGAAVKRNQQVPENSPIAHELGEMILATLERNSLFISATLPARVYPPMFNRYQDAGYFGNHIDNAIRLLGGSGQKIRTDISATLFLADPAAYDGGELLIEDLYGAHSVKLPAGHMVIYPASSLHRVNPVTRGVRLAAFFWVQSMVRDDTQRSLLFDLDTAIQRLNQTNADEESRVSLTGCYHNLLRMWAET